jgi:hypothetical protein
MPSRHQIHCISKREHNNPHERIQAIGGMNADGTRWKLSEDDAIEHIAAGKYQFFVKVGGREVGVVVAKHLDRKYLKTEADGYAPNNLLSLPECP